MFFKSRACRVYAPWSDMALLMAILFLPLQVTSQFPGLFSVDQVEQLQAARDDHDIGEGAFAVLIDVTNDGLHDADEVVTIDPDFATMLKDPARYRAQQFKLSGVLVRRSDVTRPLGLKPGTRAIEEWVVRSDKAIPFIVYVLQDGNRSTTVGQSIDLNGRFYKRLRLQTEGGDMKNYLSFVSSGPDRISRPEGITAEHGWGVVVLIAFLGGIFLFVTIVTRHSRRSGDAIRARVGHELASEMDDGRWLPEDPAEALDELKRRAGGTPS